MSPKGAADAGGKGVASTLAPVVRSTMETELTGAGFDPKALPEWESLVSEWKAKGEAGGHEAAVEAAKPLMALFAKSLGAECKDCHSGPQYAVPDETRRLVAGMWNDWVRGLRYEDSGLVFCDSCHQGKQQFLVRDDAEALSTWMAENFVAKLSRVDGKAQSCASCHGTPFRGAFLDAWKQGDASKQGG